MKIQIPDALKADMPASAWGKILAATPVVMTVIATMLAGLASSEMTRAQYARALAAQQQSKAGDQWSFFQAKRLRGALQRNTSDLLQTGADVAPFDPVTLRGLAGQLASQTDPRMAKVGGELRSAISTGAGPEALDFLTKGEIPRLAAAQDAAPKVKEALEAAESSKPEIEVAAIVSQLDDPTLAGALRAAKDRAQAFDNVTKPINQRIDELENLLGQGTTLLTKPQFEGTAVKRSFIAARLRYASLRYETEARLNQQIAALYELQVRKSNMAAERHHARSQRFFYGMLAAQMAVIIATFAMAARQRNLLWSLAAFAGIAAVALAIYVYLCV